MKQILQSLKTGVTEVGEVPCPRGRLAPTCWSSNGRRVLWRRRYARRE